MICCGLSFSPTLSPSYFLLWFVTAIRWCCRFAVSLRKRLRGETPTAVVDEVSVGPQKGLCRSCCFRASCCFPFVVFSFFYLFRFLGKGGLGRAVLVQVFRACTEPGRLLLSAVWSGSFWYRINSCNRKETHLTSFLQLHSEPFGLQCFSSVRHYTKKIGVRGFPLTLQGDF